MFSEVCIVTMKVLSSYILIKKGLSGNEEQIEYRVSKFV